MIEKDFIGNKIYGKFYFGDMEKYEQIKNNGQLENCFYYIEIPNFAYKDYTVEKDVYGPTGATQESKTDEYAYVLYLKDKEIYHSREVEKDIMNLMENYGLASILNTYQNKLDLEKTETQTIKGSVVVKETLTTEGPVQVKDNFSKSNSNGQTQFQINNDGSVYTLIDSNDKFQIKDAGERELLKVGVNGVENLILEGSINGYNDTSSITVNNFSSKNATVDNITVNGPANINNTISAQDLAITGDTTLQTTEVKGDLYVEGIAYLANTNIDFTKELDGATLNKLTLTQSLECTGNIKIESENLTVGETIQMGKNFIQIGKIKLSYNEEEGRLEIINMDTGEASTDVSE